MPQKNVQWYLTASQTSELPQLSCTLWQLVLIGEVDAGGVCHQRGHHHCCCGKGCCKYTVNIHHFCFHFETFPFCWCHLRHIPRRVIRHSISGLKCLWILLLLLLPDSEATFIPAESIPPFPFFRTLRYFRSGSQNRRISFSCISCNPCVSL